MNGALWATCLAAAPLFGDEGERLHELFEREWRQRLEENPIQATYVGVHDFDDRLPEVSLAAEARRLQATRGFLAELDAIDPEALLLGDRVSYEIFRVQLAGRIESHRYGEHLMPLSADSGFHSSFPLLARVVPRRTAAELDRFLARLHAFPAWAAGHVELMRAGLERGITIPRPTLSGLEASFDALIVEEPERHPLFEPFGAAPETIPAAERERLSAAAREAIRAAVVPAYIELRRFVIDEYLPRARTTLAASELPDGRDYYRYLIRHFTTLELEPEETHETGLGELARIRGEMDALIRATGFEGGFEEFLAFLRSDPRFYARTPEELIREASWIAKRADARLPSLFGRLPRQPYGVQAVPEHLAPKYTTGRYSGAPLDSTEPGWYWVNTYRLESRPLYNLEALTLHEAVPGHHLQIALAKELDHLPEFRRHGYLSAFGEGWGLYAEWLGLEAGFYTDPYSRFGFLTYQAWRAARLVIDTGLHAFGWERQQAIDFLAAHTALPMHECTTEVDRYISWPGQALSYKIGYLKIRELRKRAEQALGERFDLRAFHDAVLENGAVPLPVLEAHIDRLIARTLAGTESGSARGRSDASVGDGSDRNR